MIWLLWPLSMLRRVTGYLFLDGLSQILLMRGLRSGTFTTRYYMLIFIIPLFCDYNGINGYTLSQLAVQQLNFIESQPVQLYEPEASQDAPGVDLSYAVKPFYIIKLLPFPFLSAYIFVRYSCL